MKGDCQQRRCGADALVVTASDPSDLPPEDDDPCTVAACDGTTPKQQPAPRGTATADSAQTPGDCLRVICDGAGGVTTEGDPSDVPPDPGDVCRVGSCAGGVPGVAPAPAGTICGSGLVCDSAGACGACRGTGTSCAATSQCCDGYCSAGSTCQVCSAAGTGDCDGNPSTGCETRLDSATHCGRCGRACPARPNVAAAGCSNGECNVVRCAGGHADLDGIFDNGCEAPAAVGPGGGYAPCTAASAATDCGAGEQCLDAVLVGLSITTLQPCAATRTKGCFCSFPCSTAEDCPAPRPGGTATRACSGSKCYMSCSGSMTCPAGMDCIESVFVPTSPYACVHL